MKKMLTFLVGLFLLCTSYTFAQTCPTAPGSGVYVMFDSTYPLGTITAGETNVRMCFANTTSNKISGLQFRVWYDKNAFAGGAPVVTSLNTTFPQSLQYVTNTSEGSITITLAYTGNSSTFTIPDGTLFNLKLLHSANFQNFSGTNPIANMAVTGITTFPNLSSDINGLDSTLVVHNYGGVFQQQMFTYAGTFKTITGAGAKNIPVVLQKKPTTATTWTDVVTSTTDINGAFTFNEPIDVTYYDVRIHVQGDALDFGNIVTTADAQKANDIVLGNVTATGFDFYSADVNGSNTITIADVYSIFGRIAGRFTAWPNNVKDVLFFSETEYNTINNSPTNLRSTIPGVTNFDKVILPDDPHTGINIFVLGNGDSNNTGFQMARMIPIEIANPANAPYHIIDKTIEFDNVNQEIELNLPTLNNVEEGNLVNIPVKVLSNNYLLGSMQFGVWYDQSLLEFRGIENTNAVSRWMSYVNPEDNIVDWGGYDAFGGLDLVKNNDIAFTLQFVAKRPQTEWGTSPLVVTRKAAGDANSRDFNIRPTDGLVVINKINGSTTANVNDMIVYPNPTDGLVTIAFSVSNSSTINLGVYDLNGKKCIDVVTDNFPKGKYSYTVDLGNVSTGTYIAVLKHDSNNQLVAEKIIKQ